MAVEEVVGKCVETRTLHVSCVGGGIPLAPQVCRWKMENLCVSELTQLQTRRRAMESLCWIAVIQMHLSEMQGSVVGPIG